MRKLTKLEIVTETVDFYSADPKRRSLSVGGDCSYNGKNDTHCAVGRCLLPEYQEQGEFLIGNTWTFIKLAEFHETEFDEMLQEQYRGQELGFWKSLQVLHDTHVNWDKSGITFEGELAVNKIYEIYHLK